MDLHFNCNSNPIINASYSTSLLVQSLVRQYECCKMSRYKVINTKSIFTCMIGNVIGLVGFIVEASSK